MIVNYISRPGVIVELVRTSTKNTASSLSRSDEPQRPHYHISYIFSYHNND
jgi:hypothetical protein